MYLLKDNKIVNISLQEDKTTEVLATKTREQLLEEYNKPEVIVKDKIFKLNWVDDTGRGELCFQVIQSEYLDNSGTGNGHGVFRTKGQAIMNMLENGFTVTIDGKEFTA